MVKYLGSKRALVGRIERAVTALGARTAADVFTGTTRVAQALRAAGLEVHANDTATYSEQLALAYVAAGPEVDRVAVADVLAELDALPGRPGYVTETFARRARYFSEPNAGRIDAIRDRIEALGLPPVERALVLTSLLEAADRVDSTVGVQMAYLKRPAPRSLQPLRLRMPRAIPGPPGTVTREDAVRLAPALDGIDVAYLDPPYNHHSYFSNYHVWETLVRWDAPAHYGVACKRVDCRTTRSAFNARATAWASLAALVEAIPAPYLLLSFSDEGHHSPAAVRALLRERGFVAAVSVDRPRYVGARIGIHDPQGRRVGRPGRLRNTELLFVCGPDRAAVRRAAAAARRAGEVAKMG